MINTDDRLFFARISRIHRLYTKALITRLDPYNVKPGYIAILEQLWEKDGVTQKKLHSHMDIEQATLSNTLRRMERDGLIKRTQDTKDRRRTQLFLTQTAQSLESTVQSAIEDLQSVVNVGLTINDRRYFNRILRQMAQQIETDLEDPCLVLLDEVAEEPL